MLKAQEEERNRFILSRMDWDKHFTDEAAEMNDDLGGGKAQHMLSEYDENQSEKMNIVRCGKILWRSIIFGMYMLLVIVVVQTQIKAHQTYLVNESLTQHIHRLHKNLEVSSFDPYDNSTLYEAAHIDFIKDKNDTLNFLKYCLPEVGKKNEITTAINDLLPN